ncbi:MAG: 2-phosphosulfolactate phosphatase [Candidatus Zixiibacteriota bacterium]|nr:MAG: 2-phosphosulfolactate phosphatase [candidate division Zixibacteria bacterium]
MKNNCYMQSPYRCRLEWGAAGAERAARRGDIVVVVDVLSFSTSVAQAVSRGAVIYPCGEDEDTQELAANSKAEVAVRRKHVPDKGRYSLSPLTYADIDEGTRVVLPSLNGGTCVRCSESASSLFSGALVNARAVAQVVTEILRTFSLNVTVIACGEREKEPPHDLRPAIEDYLGAGAILAGIPFDKSPEARLCESAYLASEGQIDKLIFDSVSGRELREIGFEEDVKFAARTDIFATVAYLQGGAFANFSNDRM